MEVRMKKILCVLSVLLVIGVIGVACSPAPAVEELPAVAVDQMPVDDAEVEDMQPETMTEEEVAPMESQYPDWYAAALTDVNSGENFTIQDNIGKVYLVETLAVWCSNCLKQQQEVKRFHDLLGERDDFESLGINIDPNEDTGLLTDYVQKNGFDWLYVVANDEVINEISELYGPQFLNPPSTPMLIIDREGNPHPLGFGIKSAEELLAAVTPFL
jgi:hypothetical protein